MLTISVWVQFGATVITVVFGALAIINLARAARNLRSLSDR